MNRFFITHITTIIFTGYFCMAQSINFGIGFSPYETSYSTYTKVEIKSEDYITQILTYFYEVEVSSDIKYIKVDSSTTLKFQELKNTLVNFGKLETIRLLLIKQKIAFQEDIKKIIELRKKNKSLKEIAEKYGLDYINEIWLPSKKIYSEIFEVKSE
ncbi:MAG: hypothetical protein N2643_05240 [Endomicrobia bacterium]|nr:hypothetical protein [Endomicrobiia bacterium]